VFSGGEPLVQPMLPSAINDIKKMKLRVGLHTAGAVPEMLARVATAVNWIGFDVKQLFEKYSSVTGVEGSGEAARESLKILVESQVDFEVRITVYETMDASDLGDLLKEISDFGVRNVALQKCRYLDESIIEHPIFCDGLFLEDMSKYFDGFFVR
jgi:pyruvate formate lyase activating enzyme